MSEHRIQPRSRRLVHRGRVFSVEIDRVLLPHGREVEMEIVRHPPSVVLVPMPDPERVILVRQYRYAVDRWVWELPAGSVDEGEQPVEAARRECHEEIGLVPGAIEALGSFYPTPGYCDERMMFFRLGDLRRAAHEAAADEDESLEPRTFTLADALAFVSREEAVDMKTVLGLSLAMRR
jgi:ADP-ribose pyrophosphatase